jgi:hypothetical protein
MESGPLNTNSKDHATFSLYKRNGNNQVEVDEMSGACGTNREKRNRLLIGKPEGRRLLGRPRRRWVDNIWMDVGGIG